MPGALLGPRALLLRIGLLLRIALRRGRRQLGASGLPLPPAHLPLQPSLCSVHLIQPDPKLKGAGQGEQVDADISRAVRDIARDLLEHRAPAERPVEADVAAAWFAHEEQREVDAVIHQHDETRACDHQSWQEQKVMDDRQDIAEALLPDNQDRAGQAEELHHDEQADQDRIPAERQIDEYPRIDAPQIVPGAQNLYVSDDMADDKRHSLPTLEQRASEWLIR